MKTFLKWAGNKSQIKDIVKKYIDCKNRFIEPFAGSCAISLNVDAKNYIISDINNDLITLYKPVIADDRFIEYAKSFFAVENNTQEKFYEFREIFNLTKDQRLKSALFVYLNRHGFNGLCRYNSRGGFNVPFGRYKTPYFPENEMIDFKNKLKKAKFLCQDFRKTMASAKKGDVVYCDPPYIPLSKTSSFTSYAQGGFGEQDQIDLMKMAQNLREKGVRVIISNHNNEFSQNLYSGANLIEEFEVQRYISCIGEKRSRAGEVLAVYHAR